MIVSYLFSLFYFALWIMVVFSSTIIAYSVFFHTKETKFLMTCPIPVENIILYKLVETFVFATWAVLFIGLPVCFAYAIQLKLAWSFYYFSSSHLYPML